MLLNSEAASFAGMLDEPAKSSTPSLPNLATTVASLPTPKLSMLMQMPRKRKNAPKLLEAEERDILPCSKGLVQSHESRLGRYGFRLRIQ